MIPPISMWVGAWQLLWVTSYNVLLIVLQYVYWIIILHCPYSQQSEPWNLFRKDGGSQNFKFRHPKLSQVWQEWIQTYVHKTFQKNFEKKYLKGFPEKLKLTTFLWRIIRRLAMKREYDLEIVPLNSTLISDYIMFEIQYHYNFNVHNSWCPAVRAIDV